MLVNKHDFESLAETDDDLEFLRFKHRKKDDFFV